MPNILIRICDALFCALLLRRAELVEVVELAAGEYLAAPLAVYFSGGALNILCLLGGPLLFLKLPPPSTGLPLVRGIDNYLPRPCALFWQSLL